MRLWAVCQKVIAPKCLFLGLIALILYGVFPGITGAFEARKISLDQAVQLAVKHNQYLKTTKNNVRYSTLTLEKEKNDYLPLVTGTIDTRLTSDYGQSWSGGIMKQFTKIKVKIKASIFPHNFLHSFTQLSDIVNFRLICGFISQ